MFQRRKQERPSKSSKYVKNNIFFLVVLDNTKNSPLIRVYDHIRH